MVTQLDEEVWQLSLRGVNAYVVDGAKTVLVDAGTPWDGEQIRAGLAEVGLDVGAIDRVLLTHFDLDHVGALPSLAPDLDAPVHIRPPDNAFLTGQRRPPWRNHKGLLQRVLGLFLSRPPFPIEPVSDGESLGSFTAYATPGHTPGHTAYVSEAAGLGALGDLVREADGVLKPSPWVVSYDTTRVRESIVALDDSAPAFETAAMGHGTPVTGRGREALAETAAAVRS